MKHDIFYVRYLGYTCCYTEADIMALTLPEPMINSFRLIVFKQWSANWDSKLIDKDGKFVGEIVTRLSLCGFKWNPIGKHSDDFRVADIMR